MGVFILELTHPLKHMALASSVHGDLIRTEGAVCVGVWGGEGERSVSVG